MFPPAHLLLKKQNLKPAVKKVTVAVLALVLVLVLHLFLSKIQILRILYERILTTIRLKKLERF